MSQIHATAIIGHGARLGPGVQVGPYCIIGPQVTLGEGCRLDSMVRIDGPTTIGPDCHFFHGAAIGGAPQDLKYQGAPSQTRIGERNTFREYCTIHRATAEGEATVIGNENLIMAYAHVAHNCVVGSRVILGNAATIAGHVRIDDFALISGVVPVHQFTRIGAHCIIGGGLRVPKDVPPFVRAGGMPLRIAGLNLIGLERRGFSPETIKELKKLYRIFFRSKLIKEQALAQIRRECQPLPEIDYFCRFVEESVRGLTR